MKLRTGMLLGGATLVAVIIAAIVLAVVIFIGRAERAGLHDDLVRSNRVFADLLASRHSVLRSDCRVIANEPRLRALVATRDISRETILGVLTELRTALGSDLFLFTDGVGTLVADAVDPEAEGFDMSGNPAIAAALAGGEGKGVWIAKDLPYQVQACRIDFGNQTVGIIVVGRIFDDAVAQLVLQQSGSTLIIGIDGRPVAASPLPGGARPDRAPTAGDDVRELDVFDSTYVAIGGRFPLYEGKRVLTYSVMRSLDEALAPGRRLTWSILGIAGISLAVALVLAIALSRRLSRPVDQLVQFTRRVGQGELAARAEPRGPTEVRVLASAMNRMVGDLETSRDQLADKKRLEREMEIAMRIQTSILPTTLDIAGLEIAATMIPASEVGGDYYDVLPAAGGGWIGIGDVAGHGLTAGLEMLMVQSAIAALVEAAPDASPSAHVSVLNKIIYENIHNRLHQDEHMTLTLMRYRDGGHFTFAGAHEEIVVCREAGACERVATPGTWLGAMRDVTRVTQDTTLELAPGDLMVLYSDGVIEARDAMRAQFGIDQLCGLIEAARSESVEVVRDRIVAAVKAWETIQDDDITVVVVRRARR